VLACGYFVELSLEVRATAYTATIPVRLDLARPYAFDLVADTTRPYNESHTAVYGADSADRLGDSVATGDINGDGFEDLILGARERGGPGDANGEPVWREGEPR